MENLICVTLSVGTMSDDLIIFLPDQEVLTRMRWRDLPQLGLCHNDELFLWLLPQRL